MSWQEDYIKLNKAGYSEEDIEAEKTRQVDVLRKGGYPEEDINNYFGVKEPDMSVAKSMVQENLQSYKPEEAHTYEDAIAAGFQLSNIKQLKQSVEGKSIMPEKVVSEDAPLSMHVAQQGAQIVSDIPSMAGGALVGGEIGGVIGGGLGTLAMPFVGPMGPLGGYALGKSLGAAAGAWAAPTMIRSLLMNYYEKGEIKDPADFMRRLGSVFMDTTKSGTVGVATEMIGGKAGEIAIAKGAKTLTAATAKLAAEVTTMTTVAAGLEGEMPKAKDFTSAAILIGAFHGTSKTMDFSFSTVKKLRRIYEETGTPPEAVVRDAGADPHLKQELLSTSEEIPTAYKSQIDPEHAKIKERMDMHQKPVEKVEPEPQYSPELKDALAHIDSRMGEAKPQKESFADKVKEFISNPVAKAVDRFEPVKGVSEQAYKEFRMLNSSAGKTWNFIFDGARDFATGDKTGKSLYDITREVGSAENNKNFKRYLIAKRQVEDLSPRNIDQKIDYDKAKLIVDHFEPQFKEHAKDYYEWNNKVLQYGIDSGLFNADDVAAIQALNKHHVSFRKVIDLEPGKGKGSAKLKNIGNSDLLIKDPYLSAAETSANVIRLAERNRALVSFKEAAVKQGAIEKVATPKIENKATVEEMNQFFRDLGIDHEIGEGQTLSLWRAGRIEDQPGQFSVMVDGKREVYKFTPEFEGSLLETSVTELTTNPLIQNPAFEAMRGITKFKKLSITLAPVFKVNNLFKDYLTHTVKSGDPATPSEVLSAAMSIVKKDAEYIDYLNSGAANAGFINPDIIAQKLNTSVAMVKENGEYRIDKSIGKRVWNTIETAKEYNQALSEISDNTMRLIEFNRKKKTGPKIDAAMAARDVTLDFDKRGQSAALANWTAISAFSRVAINGIENTISTLKNNPNAKYNAMKYITIPTVLLWAANKTDKRMRDIPDWEKLVFWHVPTYKWVPVNEDNILKYNSIKDTDAGSYLIREGENGPEMNEGMILRIPKPELYGTIFGTLPEQALDQIYERFIENGQPEEATKMVDNVLGLVKPNLLPDFATPIIEQYSNKSMFTGNKIIPFGLEQASPEHQYTEYTTDAARAIGAFLGHVPFIGKSSLNDKTISSPMIVENYVRSWGGSNGIYALQAISALIPDSVYQSSAFKSTISKPALTVADIPEVKRLISKYPQLNSKPIADFEKQFDEYSQEIADYNQAKKEMNLEEAVGIKAKALSDYGAIAATHKAMQAAHMSIRYIKLADISPEEKTQMIEAAYFQMNEIAKKGLEQARQSADSIKELNKGE